MGFRRGAFNPSISDEGQPVGKHHAESPSRKFRPGQWVGWSAAISLLVCLITIGGSRYRMWQVKAEVEALGGRLVGSNQPPHWYFWLVAHTPEGVLRRLVSQGSGQFHRVVSVQLDGCRYSTGLLQRLRCFQQVTHINLRGTTVTDFELVALKDFPKLKMLSLDDTPVSDAGVQPLLELKELVSLGLSNTLITAVSLKQLDLPNLVEVSTPQFQMTSADWQQVANMRFGPDLINWGPHNIVEREYQERGRSSYSPPSRAISHLPGPATKTRTGRLRLRDHQISEFMTIKSTFRFLAKRHPSTPPMFDP